MNDLEKIEESIKFINGVTDDAISQTSMHASDNDTDEQKAARKVKDKELYSNMAIGFVTIAVGLVAVLALIYVV